jgi:uncharacterized damage-inducible protein DinB
MLEDLVRQSHWANARTLAWLQGDIRDREYFVRLVSHILRTERVWLDRIHGRPASSATFDPLFLNQMAPWNDETLREWLALFATVRPDQAYEYKTFDGTPSRSKVQDMIFHSFSHCHHHRGQMAARAAALGLSFPNLAYITYTRIATVAPA